MIILISAGELSTDELVNTLTHDYGVMFSRFFCDNTVYTCKGRCGDKASAADNSSCSCHIGCMEEGTCCYDFIVGCNHMLPSINVREHYVSDLCQADNQRTNLKTK